MGIEAFGISMKFERPGILAGLKEFLANRSHIFIKNTGMTALFETTTGEYNDNVHIIDLQIMREVASNRCSLAIRFSLCAHDSVDPIFIDLVRDVLTSWEANVWLMTSALKQKANYLPGDEQWLIAALPDEIIALREHWQSLFGNKQGTVRANESFSFVGFKK